MKSKKSKGKENWVLARTQAAQLGIVLTRRKNSDGNYVCYLRKNAKRNG
jgi:hypothetical protein